MEGEVATGDTVSRGLIAANGQEQQEVDDLHVVEVFTIDLGSHQRVHQVIWFVAITVFSVEPL